MSRVLLHNAILFNEGRRFRGWLVTEGARIAAIGEGDYGASDHQYSSENHFDHIVDFDGDWLLPGVIDTHVHFRDPGLTHKADIATESRAAVAGGVTSYLEMPNTAPPTVDLAAWEAKMRRAAQVSVANYAFFIGATDRNLSQLLAADYSRVPGVKLFMGSSTGNMLVDSGDSLDALFSSVSAIIAVHAEDEATIVANRDAAIARYGSAQSVPVAEHPAIRSRQACLTCTRRALDLARRHNARLHLLHVSTADEAALFATGPLDGKRITAEACVGHLWFTDADYATRGTRIKCNPAIKTAADRDALRQALADGRIDVVATDHAPHLLDEKQGGALTAASGSPMIQFSLPVMLEMAAEGIFTPEMVVEKMCHAPARLYGIDRRGFLRQGFYADLVRVRPAAEWTVTDADVISRCGWTPLQDLSGHGTTLTHRVITTWVNGAPAYDASSPVDPTPALPLEFNHTPGSHS